MNYTLDDIGIKIVDKEISRNDGIYRDQERLKSALILELEMLTNNFIEAFDGLKIAVEKSDECKIWYSLSMLIYSRENILQVLDQMKSLFDDKRDDVEIGDLRDLLGKYTDKGIKEDEMIGDFGKQIRNWVERSEKDLILEYNVFEKTSIPNLDVRQMIKHFDPETFELTIFDKKFELEKLNEMVKDINENIDDIYRKNYLAF